MVFDSPVLLVRVMRRHTNNFLFLSRFEHSCYFPSPIGLKCKNVGFINKCIPDGDETALKNTLNDHKDDNELNDMLVPFETDAQGIVDETAAMIRSSVDNGIELSESVMGNCASSVSGQSAANVQSCFGGSVDAAGDDLDTNQSSSE